MKSRYLIILHNIAPKHNWNLPPKRFFILLKILCQQLLAGKKHTRFGKIFELVDPLSADVELEQAWTGLSLIQQSVHLRPDRLHLRSMSFVFLCLGLVTGAKFSEWKWPWLATVATVSFADETQLLLLWIMSANKSQSEASTGSHCLGHFEVIFCAKNFVKVTASLTLQQAVVHAKPFQPNFCSIWT